MTLVDPPSGWRYGYPKPLEEDYRAQLIRDGYPPEEIEFALQYSRLIEAVEEGAVGR